MCHIIFYVTYLFDLMIKKMQFYVYCNKKVMSLKYTLFMENASYSWEIRNMLLTERLWSLCWQYQTATFVLEQQAVNMCIVVMALVAWSACVYVCVWHRGKFKFICRESNVYAFRDQRMAVFCLFIVVVYVFLRKDNVCLKVFLQWLIQD